jgi:hypothetical protein
MRRVEIGALCTQSLRAEITVTGPQPVDTRTWSKFELSVMLRYCTFCM